MSAAISASSTSAKPARDPRLDFFRGVGMYIILIAHISGNPWTLWIPARFGFSDATEIFVFCSGMASAIAFGSIFRKAGWMMGTLRIMHRVWQVYWAHIGVFVTGLFAMLVLNMTGWFEKDYVGSLNLYPFLNNPGPNTVGLMTLTYVPNYFDILPMYLVILAMLPLVMALARVHPFAAIGFCAALWLVTSVTGFGFPAEYWFENSSTRQWFFNPFAWQLIFFTGFAFMAGWLPAPPVNRVLILLALIVVLMTIPFAWFRIYREYDFIREWRGDWSFLFTKTDFGILRYIHFLSLAYLAWLAAGPDGSRLSGGRWWNAMVGVIRKVGQQSLAVFMTSMILARLLGVLFDVFGRSMLNAAVVNLLGAAIITGVAYFVAYLKRQPWRQAASPAALSRQPVVTAGISGI
ncbi:OpgC family protein [Paracoccus alkanivorans]|uniref:OpgC domain-containing protein n=1 Tax=Paracoccus alkanivorans TaxID=2116655 RepID=A0A3M0MCX8_9RHOB|nr:OpgC domain-containing protein [Paracoccus alkanivorans]RMC35439.1 OpgC domain-containing protein [Paracoccus alkanivorans]